MKPRIKVSFSGGRTSAYMAGLIKRTCADTHELLFTFANTTREDDRTLIFVDQVDKYFDLNLVWLEAVVDPREGFGTTHRVVDFNTAKRDGSVFRDVVRKFGIPNQVFQPCNRELKLRPMHSYCKSIGWDSYTTAIGIRADENRRVDKKSAPPNIWYPLRDTWPTDKQDVLSYWEDQPFDLQIEEFEGNCLACFKKSNKKLFQLIATRPEVFDFHRELDSEFEYAGAPHYGVAPPPGTPPSRRPFRGKLTTTGLFEQASLAGIIPGSGRRIIPIGVSDENGGCSESCEVYEMEEDLA